MGNAGPQSPAFGAVLNEIDGVCAETAAAIAVHRAVAAVSAMLCGVARTAGLVDLGRQVDSMERSIRRGEGKRELAETLRRDVNDHLKVKFFEHAPV